MVNHAEEPRWLPLPATLNSRARRDTLRGRAWKLGLLSKCLNTLSLRLRLQVGISLK